ncbi:MAG: hypothetical protein EKK64_06685 [Neisseriaceae bacterium]|nr:MAG: hypothetical protein EKK64_06685 [Neisseriaceae bacterium]
MYVLIRLKIKKVSLKKNYHLKEYWKLLKKGFHRKKGPALTWENGSEEWHDAGIQYQKIETDFSTETLTMKPVTKIAHLHSFSDNPAIIYKNGTKEWYCIDDLHRRDGPAVVYSNGDKEYWIQGKRHREDGPAVIYGNKQYWYKNGEFKKCIS